LAQCDRLANAPQSGQPDAGGIYHATVRLSLEPDRHFLGLTGLWRFSKNGIDSACGNVRFQVFRTVTNDIYQSYVCPQSSHLKIESFAQFSNKDTNLICLYYYEYAEMQ
jgi:hypothetical protein